MRLAARRGVDCISLTDHDDTGGLAEAEAEAGRLGIRFVPGVEVSATWRSHTTHIVGLGIDPAAHDLAEGLAYLREGRERRAQGMALELERIGICGSLEGARAHARNPQLLTRTHFARFLVERRYALEPRSVFRQYLAPGKPGYVPHEWAPLPKAVGWIRSSGGIAVLAHPGRYRLSQAELEALLAGFRDCGGQGLEVACGLHTPRQCARYARFARRFGLAASRGSDYHGPGEGAELGSVAALPWDLKPVWSLL